MNRDSDLIIDDYGDSLWVHWVAYLSMAAYGGFGWTFDCDSNMAQDV